MPGVTQKGQVTIPVAVRRALRIKAGDQVVFEVRDGKVEVRKKAGSEAIDKYLGFLEHLRGKDPDRILDELRGSVDDCSG